MPLPASVAETSLGTIANLHAHAANVTRPGWRTTVTPVVLVVLGAALVVVVAPIAFVLGGPETIDKVGGAVVPTIFGVFFLGAGLLVRRAAGRSIRAGELANAGRLDEADALLARASGFASPITEGWRATIASLRGDDAAALACAERSIAACARLAQIAGSRGASLPLAVPLAWAKCTAARACCNLGRVDDARAILATLGEVGGDLLPLLAATTALYVDFCTGSTTIDDARAKELVASASSVRGSWGLLALCAWRAETRGDEAECARLVAEERRRDRCADLARLMPRLWTWMSARG